MQILVVGGGGGGVSWEAGYGAGGGGGGGGYKEVLAQEVLAGSYTITVGAGGAWAWGQGTVGGGNGGASSFGTLISVSGGGGGAGSLQTTGKTGGSGGGGFMNGGIGGSAISGEGHPGGTSSNPSNYRGGGGGGAGSAGGNATETSGGNGGDGKASSITGTSIYRAAGGRGGWIWSPENYNGLGYGNAGSGGQAKGGSLGAGVAGVVIVRYLTTDFGNCTGGTKTTDGNYTVHEFTTSGTFVVITAPVLTTDTSTLIGSTQITGNGNITATGGETVTERGFCYKAGTSGDPTTADDTVLDTGSFNTGAFSKAITGLTPNTYYRVRAYAINSVGTSYGVTYTVLTASVDTNTATYIKTVSLTGNATTSSYPLTTYSRRGFCYKIGTSGDPTISDSVAYDDGTFPNESYSKEVTGLTENTNYRLRAYVVDVNGSITYGDTIQILTETTPTSSGSFITLLNR